MRYNNLTIKRICRMERYFDEVSAAKTFSKTINRKLRALDKYMASGLWLSDYEYDERGKLPKNLKRGVLSEDALYNMLMEFDK
ncbi:MAG: DUF4298 domain-containing protein [Clostridia bacterium]|nr:DUF4298 domain-containing protein [Clostridia bacterium]